MNLISRNLGGPGVALLGSMLLVAFSAEIDGQGGPYKVIAGDFTGDQVPDIVFGSHRIGVVSVEQGDRQGRLEYLAHNAFETASPAFAGRMKPGWPRKRGPDEPCRGSFSV